MSAAQAFLAALATALNTDAGLKALLESGRGASLTPPLPAYLIEAPPDEPFPYLTFNIATDDSWDTSDGFGGELTADIHAFTQGLSAAANYALRDRAAAIATDPAWALSAANLVYCRPSSRRMLKEGQNIYHGVVSVRALIEL